MRRAIGKPFMNYIPHILLTLRQQESCRTNAEATHHQIDLRNL